MADPRVEAAIAHWAPRYVENGVPVGDFREVSESVERWDDWCRAWSDRAALHEAEGDAAGARGRNKSAAYHLLTAAVCFHFGKFLFVHDLDQMRAAHERAVRAHRKAHALLAPPIERIEIPYGDGPGLVANLRKPVGLERPPIVVMFPGLDSAKEELGAYGRWFVERGMATVEIDGPGQGEAEYDYPIEPHYEKPAGAVIDVLEQRDDLDTDRLGAWGVSLGGYYVVRAAAYEPRIKALVSLSGPFRFVEKWDEIPDISRLAFQVRSHAPDEPSARAIAERLDLTTVVGDVTCPAFVVGGDRDRLIPPEAATAIAAGVSGTAVLHVVPGGNHVVNNKAYLYRPQTADWMADQLGVAAG